jgi:hypothetical protein
LTPSLYLRFLLAGAVLGIPSYVLGVIVYGGWRPRTEVLVALGAGVGLAAGLSLIGAVVWPLVVMFAFCMTVTGAVMYGWMPQGQDTFGRYVANVSKNKPPDDVGGF